MTSPMIPNKNNSLVDAPELKPCPFCGSAGEFETTTDPDKTLNSVRCQGCQFSLMNGPVGIGWHATKADAADAWNRRDG